MARRDLDKATTLIWCSCILGIWRESAESDLAFIAKNSDFSLKNKTRCVPFLVLLSLEKSAKKGQKENAMMILKEWKAELIENHRRIIKELEEVIDDKPLGTQNKLVNFKAIFEEMGYETTEEAFENYFFVDFKLKKPGEEPIYLEVHGRLHYLFQSEKLTGSSKMKKEIFEKSQKRLRIVSWEKMKQISMGDSMEKKTKIMKGILEEE